MTEIVMIFGTLMLALLVSVSICAFTLAVKR